MKRREYERLQEALSALMKPDRLKDKGISGKQKEGYETAILAAKSALKADFYQYGDHDD